MPNGNTTLRDIFEELRAMDPRTDEERAAGFARMEDGHVPVERLLRMDVEAEVHLFAPDEKLWTYDLQEATVDAVFRHSAGKRPRSGSDIDRRLQRLIDQHNPSGRKADVNEANPVEEREGGGDHDQKEQGEDYEDAGTGVRIWEPGVEYSDDTPLLRSASTVRPRRFQHLNENPRIPIGVLTLVAGLGGLGKSTLGTTLTADVSQARQVIVVSSEDDWEATIAPRLMAAGANMDNVFYPTDSAGKPARLRLPKDHERLAAYAAQLDDLALIVLDPMTAFVDTKEVNNNDDPSVRAILDPLGGLAAASRCAVVGLLHFNKREDASVFLRLAGSGAYFNSARSVLVWAQQDPGSDERYLAHAKNNVGPLAPTERYRIELVDTGAVDDEGPLYNTKVTLLGHSHVTAEALVNPPSEGRAGDKTAEAMEIIETLWNEHRGPVPAKVITSVGDEQGISERTMKRALERLGGTTDKDGYGQGSKWMWAPPAGHFSAPPENVTPSGNTPDGNP